MEMYMKVNGMKIKRMDMECIRIQMGQNMKEIGKKINRMVLEKKVGLTVLRMKENINKEKKSGQGKFKWADGSTYEGQFEDNNINGKGIYTWGDKRKYIGDWKNNKMDGHGVFTWPDGRKYQGDYKDDKKDGFGIFEWADGKKYKGYWTNGKQNGEGEFYNDQTKTWRKCLVQNGRRVKWLDE